MEFIFNHPDFDLSCTCAALLFVYLSPKFMEDVFCVMFFEFLLCRFASFIGLDITDILSGPGLYFAYAIIQLCVIIKFTSMVKEGKRVSSFIIYLYLISSIYNFTMIAPYYGYTVYSLNNTEMRIIFTNLMCSIMILQLFYMMTYNTWILNRLGKHARLYTRTLDAMYLCHNRRSVEIST